ncbi:hypothetical protein FACS1894170_12650 [Planctomycetales bacterium]|nr:hypothetical protein FACS1894170_12650 [Planctomycetales bacterium]
MGKNNKYHFYLIFLQILNKIYCKKIKVTSVAFCLLIVLVGYYSVVFVVENIPIGIPFVGPINKPNWKGMEWKEFQAFYWLCTEKPGTERQNSRYFQLSQSDILLLQQSLSIGKIKGFGVPCSRSHIMLVTDKGHWRIDYGLPLRIYITLDENTDYSYIVELNDTKFYETMRQLCFDNEKK